MPNKWILISLSTLVVVTTGVTMYILDDTKLSSYGTMAAAAGSFLAVIWFTGSLWYQAQQLSEQKTQFLAQFKQHREEGRRNALLLAREILSNAESRALSYNPNLRTLSELPLAYMEFSELKDILESHDVEVVQTAVNSWLKKEGPALILMRGIKTAAQVYFLAVGKEDVDYSKEPEDFVYIYGSHLWSLPFFEAYHIPTAMLTEVMIRIQPGRKSVEIATLAVMVRIGGETTMKMDSVRETIKDHVAKGYPLPKIAEGL